MKSAEFLCPDKQQLFKSVSLSAKTEAERINEIASDLRCKLKEKSIDFAAFSINELLEIIPMKGKIGSQDIFSEIKTIIDKYKLNWDKMVGFESDGAAAIVGKKNGILLKVRNIVKQAKFQNKYCSIHCIIHQEALCAKSLQIDNVMETVTKTVNFTRGRALNYREFVALLEEIESKEK